jgi:mannose-6-phosphate isomerase-like protein (cupin superfamily)
MVGPQVQPITGGREAYRRRFAELAENKGPTFFHLAAQLPRQGRTDTVFAASENMTVILKTYAVTGENELHRHPVEDHVFVVLQGDAEFYGPNDETRRVGRYDGVFLPNTAYYSFKAVGEEPLVMLRIGAKTDPDADVMTRVDPLEHDATGLYKGQKSVELVLHDDRYFG